MNNIYIADTGAVSHITTVKVLTTGKYTVTSLSVSQSVCCVLAIFLLRCVCVCVFPSGASLDFPLAGGVCVRQPGRHHCRLEPATAALKEQ